MGRVAKLAVVGAMAAAAVKAWPGVKRFIKSKQT